MVIFSAVIIRYISYLWDRHLGVQLLSLLQSFCLLPVTKGQLSPLGHGTFQGSMHFLSLCLLTPRSMMPQVFLCVRPALGLLEPSLSPLLCSPSRLLSQHWLLFWDIYFSSFALLCVYTNVCVLSCKHYRLAGWFKDLLVDVSFFEAVTRNLNLEIGYYPVRTQKLSVNFLLAVFPTWVFNYRLWAL